MNRRIRLFIIALLEITWLLLGAGMSLIFIFRATSASGVVGLVLSVLFSLVVIAGLGGMVFLFVEIHYSLRVIENVLAEDLQEIKALLSKLAKIDYRTYELFYDQFYGGASGESSSEGATGAGEMQEISGEVAESLDSVR